MTVLDREQWWPRGFPLLEVIRFWWASARAVVLGRPSYNFSYFLTERGGARCLPSSNPSRRVLAPSLAPSARTRSNSLHTCAQACYAIYKVHGSSGS